MEPATFQSDGWREIRYSPGWYGPHNAWFVGFVEDVEHPLAFVVFLEGGGSGSSAAGSVASRLLQAAIEAGY